MLRSLCSGVGARARPIAPPVLRPLMPLMRRPPLLLQHSVPSAPRHLTSLAQHQAAPISVLRSPATQCLRICVYSITRVQSNRVLSRPFTSLRRHMSSGPSGRREQARDALDWIQNNKVLLGVTGGAILVMYGFYRISMRMMTFFLNVPPQQIFTVGMAVGAVTTALAVMGLRTGRRYFLVRIDDIFDAANKVMRTEPARTAVKKALGEYWRPGKFRGYAMERLGDAALGSERRARSSYFEMPSQRVQMIFEVKGLDHNGIVSLEGYKRGGEYHFEMLSLDVPATGEHLLMAGTKDHVLFPEIVNILEGAKKQGEAKARNRG